MATEVLSLARHLLQRPAVGQHAPASATVASCLEAALPVYAFPTFTIDEEPRKLFRVDSLPSVPDYDESSCDSPRPLHELAPCGLGHGDSFNDVPLSLYDKYADAPSFAAQRPAPFSDFRGALSTPSSDDEGMCVPTLALPHSRHLAPRRHASDVARVVARGGGAESEMSVVRGGPSAGLLQGAMMEMWDERADRGLFRYDVTQCPSRVLPGRLGFVAQLNEGRATKKRPTECAVDAVLQPFDAAKFNFKKAALSEVLFAFQPLADVAAATALGSEDGSRALLPAAAPLARTARGDAASADGGPSPHLVLINVSPIDHGHSLLVPRVLDNLPQRLDGPLVGLALRFACELGNPAFRVGYNSLGAYGTINHLHLHTYCLPLPLPVERATSAPLPGRLAYPGAGLDRGCAVEVFGRKRAREAAGGGTGGSVRVSRLVDYPVRSFVVEYENADGSTMAGGAAASTEAVEAVAAVVGRAVEVMQEANQPYNIIISDAGARVFIFPQCYAARQAAGEVAEEVLNTGINPASFEIAGHLVIKRAEDYEGASEAWASTLLAAVSLEEGPFMSLAEACFGAVPRAGAA